MKRSVRLPTELDKQNNPLTREKLVQALAVALMLDEEAGTAMAGCDTAMFVITVMPIVRRLTDLWGYSYTTDDIREVHYHLRRHVASRAGRNGLPVLPIRGGRVQGLNGVR
jgi:hypothetical protein